MRVANTININLCLKGVHIRFYFIDSKKAKYKHHSKRNVE